MERTFVMVKPDGVQRGLVGEIVGRMERKGLKLRGIKMMIISRETAEKHYAEHKGKVFFEELIQFITSGPVVAMVWEGDAVVAVVRRIMGSTHPQEAGPGTIRGDLASSMNFNLIHGSDSEQAAMREIGLFFDPEELWAYPRSLDQWI